jgi:hypothetical protein
MFVAAQRSLSVGRTRVRHVPEGTVFERMTRSAPYKLMQVALLGGGTLIGHEEFRRPLEATIVKHPDVAAFTYGSGVEDPALDRAGTPATQRMAELRRWAPLLSNFESVGVRGPLSRKLLAEVGVDSAVVGDPALLLGGRIAGRPRGIVGVNGGITANLWGGDTNRVQRELGRFCRAMSKRGLRVRLFSMWPQDEAYLREVERLSGVDAELVTVYDDVDRVLASLAECDAFAGLKLHSVVLASAVGVPAAMIEYQPKFRDFQLSIGRGDYTIRTDELTASRLESMVLELAANRVAHAKALSAAVDGRRVELSALNRRIMQSAARA